MSVTARIAGYAGAAIVSSAVTYWLVRQSEQSDDQSTNKQDLTLDQSAKRQQKAEKWLPRIETKGNQNLDVNSLAERMSIDDPRLDLSGKRVLVRVDYNVPIQNGIVTDAKRIVETLDTIRYLLNYRGSKGGVKAIVLIAHLGQPKLMAKDFKRENYTLRPAAEVLKTHLGVPVTFLPDCVGPDIEKAINSCAPGSVFLCENLRFHVEEIGSEEDQKGQKIKAPKEKIELFRDQLARLADVFVFEAFGAAHRPHSSINGLKGRVPLRVAGLLMKKELSYFSQVLGQPKKPFVAIIGGAKVSDKIQVIENLLQSVDAMIIGGGMAYTFKKVVDNVAIGSSLFDEPGSAAAVRIMEKAKEKGVAIYLPTDHVIADRFSADARTGVTDDEQGIPDGWMALDVGPQSRSKFSEVLAEAKTIIWNGPMGVFEKGPFAAGTLSVMCDCVRATRRGATVIIGGGDTGAASSTFYYHHRSCAEQVNWVSTGGGSSLVLMEGKMLPGVEGLTTTAELIAAKN